MPIIILLIIAVVVSLANLFDPSILSYVAALVIGGSLLVSVVAMMFFSRAFSGRFITRDMIFPLLLFTSAGVATIWIAVTHPSFSISIQRVAK